MELENHLSVLGPDDERSPDLMILPFGRSYVLGENPRGFYEAYARDIEPFMTVEEPIPLAEYPSWGEPYSGEVPLVLRLHLACREDLTGLSEDEDDLTRFNAEVVSIARKLMKRYFHLPFNADEINASPPACNGIVLASGWDLVEGVSKRTIRYQFPLCRTKVENFVCLFYPDFATEIEKARILEHLSPAVRDHLKVSYDELFPYSEWTSPLPLYGSKMSPLESPTVLYEVASVFELSSDDDTPTHWADIYDEELFMNGETREEVEDTDLVFFLSMRYSDKFNAVEVKDRNSPNTPAISGVDKIKVANKRGTPLQLCRAMIQIIIQNPEEYRDYVQVIGEAIYGSDQTQNSLESREGLKLFLTAMQYLDPEYSENVAKIVYESYRMNKTQKSFCSLCSIVKLKNPVEYEAWHKVWVDAAAQQALEAKYRVGANMISEVFYRIRFTDFRFHDKTWWYFQNGNGGNGFWKLTDADIFLFGAITDDLQEYFVSMLHNLEDAHDQNMRDEDQHGSKKTGSEQKAVMTILENLQKQSFIFEIITFLRKSFMTPDFSTWIDQNPNLTGMRNGVIEVSRELHRAFFRPSLPEDYISRRTNVYYEEKRYHMNHPDIQFLLKWFHDLWDHEVVLWFLRFCASCLIGANQDKIYLVLTGQANNGKSALVRLLKYVWGSGDSKYFVTMPGKSLGGGPNGGPSPEWARTDGKRVILVNELQGDVPTQQLKMVSGGDDMYTRGLYSNGKEITPMGKIIITCNEPPSMGTDQSMRDRMVMIYCKARYTMDPSEVPDTEEEQRRQRIYPADPALEARIPKLAPAFFWLIKEYFPEYCLHGVRDLPKSMKEAAEQYWGNYDYFIDFLNNHLEKSNEAGAKVEIKSLHPVFSNWLMTQYPGRAPESAPSFTYQVRQRKAYPKDETGRFILGYTLRRFQDEEEEEYKDEI